MFYDANGNEVHVGDRVQLHPATDLWMRGAKFGEVVKLWQLGNEPALATVKLDKVKARKVFKMTDIMVLEVSRLPQE